MKKTLKEDLDRIILEEELIGDNSLIQYVYDLKQDMIDLGVRFVAGMSIQEHIIKQMTVHEYASNLHEIVRFNEEKSAIALFKKQNKNYVLENCYDLNEHAFASIEFTDLEYNQRFPNNPVNERFVLQKKK